MKVKKLCQMAQERKVQKLMDKKITGIKYDSDLSALIHCLEQIIRSKRPIEITTYIDTVYSTKTGIITITVDEENIEKIRKIIKKDNNTEPPKRRIIL